MPECVETGVILTFDEIRLLLGRMGFASFEGIRMPEKEVTEEEVIYVLEHLTKEQILRAEDSGFVMRKDMKEMLTIMGTPERTFLWKPEEDKGPVFFCYVKQDHVVVSELYRTKRDAVRLCMFTGAEFERWREQTENDYRGD